MTAVMARGLGIGTVLEGVDIRLPPGEALGVVGVNGAGKSTLLALLAGVLRPDEGWVRVPPDTAYLPEGCPLDPGIRVRHWLTMARKLPGWQDEVAKELVRELDLPLDRRANRLSQGQRVRLGLALTLGRSAPCYLLDDPFLGLDPVGRRLAERWIARRASEATLVIAAQQAEALERLCTRMLLLHRGRIIAEGTLDAWRERYRSVRVTGASAALATLRPSVLATQESLGSARLLLDDPAGQVEAVLRTAGGEVSSLPLPIDEVLEALVARDRECHGATPRSTSEE